MDKIFKIGITIWLIILTIISLAALCRTFYHNIQLDWDYSGILVGILALLCTVLIGWQIFSVVNLKDFEQKLKDDKKERENDTMQIMHQLFESISTVCAMIAAGSDKTSFASMSTYCDVLRAIALEGAEQYERCDQVIMDIIKINPRNMTVSNDQFRDYRECLKVFSKPRNLKNYDKLVDWVMKLNVSTNADKPA